MDENPYKSPLAPSRPPRRGAPTKFHPLVTCGCMVAVLIGALTVFGIGSLFGAEGASFGSLAALLLIIGLIFWSRLIPRGD